MHAAVIATLPSTANRTYTLTMGTFGDLNVEGNSGASYMVDIESIQIEEQGPGGISSMSFTIRDPNKEVVVMQGDLVEFREVGNNRPQFKGFVQSWSYSGIIERTVPIECIGVEKVLDWMVVPSMTIPSGTLTRSAIQAAYAGATGIGFPLQAFSTDGNDGYYGSQSSPIAAFQSVITTTSLQADVSIDGDTLRNAIEQIFAASLQVNDIFGSTNVVTPAITVDFYGGLRAWRNDDAPSDYQTQTIAESSGDTATSLDHDTDAAGVPHQVYVKGGNAAGSGVVADGSGIVGEVASLDDSSITTVAGKQAAGIAYLEKTSIATRGTYTTITGFTPPDNIRGGSLVTITNTAAGLSAQTFVIASIRKIFTAAKQTWTVSYGGLHPSMVRQTRRLTRFVKS